MAGSKVYIAPYEVIDESILAGAVWTSPEIEIPCYANGISLSHKSDVDGMLEIQKELGGVFQTFDTLPITGGDPVMPTKVYAFRFPKLKMIFTPALGVAAVISNRVEVTTAVRA